LYMDGSGNLYGTTPYGGADGFGTVFEIAASGSNTVPHSFGGTDGAGPLAGLIADADGNYYGTTGCGGAYGEARYSCVLRAAERC
jgi:uncharacterized repeat protein (TIGR03803 family)